MNPGPAMRVEILPSESALRAKVDAVLAIQEELADVLRSRDLHRITSAVRHFFRDDGAAYVRAEIIEELGRHGFAVESGGNATALQVGR